MVEARISELKEEARSRLAQIVESESSVKKFVED